MNLLIDAFAAAPSPDSPSDALLIATLRITVVLLLAITLGIVLGRASASVRHRVYALALVATVVVPVIWAVVPSVPVGIIAAEKALPVEPVLAAPQVAPAKVSDRMEPRPTFVAPRVGKDFAALAGATTKKEVNPRSLEGMGLIECVNPEAKRNLQYEITPRGRAAVRDCPRL